jgi:hypothetical protein
MVSFVEIRRQEVGGRDLGALRNFPYVRRMPPRRRHVFIYLVELVDMLTR